MNTPSGKHTVRTLTFDVSEDPDTGARVTRLTPKDITCHRNYFYQKCFTNDGSKLLYGGEYGPGEDWHYHLLDLKTGTALQLTDQPEENTFGGFLSSRSCIPNSDSMSNLCLQSIGKILGIFESIPLMLNIAHT